MKRMVISIMLLLLVPAAAWSAPFVMDGDYVKTAVSDNGTLGYGGSISPGILHDPTGTATFGADDYLTPGSPWELFAINSDQSGNLVNNNASSTDLVGSITSTTSVIYDNYVRWEGLNSYFAYTLDTFFNEGDERISFTTQITARTDLSGLTFLRSLDPDPDVVTNNSYDTVNARGYDANGDGDFDDTGDIAPENWVHAEGDSTGLTIGLYSDSDFTHNTGISYSWDYVASIYLNATDDGNGDNTIGLAFDLGSLAMGDSVQFDYAYIMGSSLEDIEIPSTVPEPSTWLLLGSGLVGLAFYRRKKTVKQ